MSDDLHYRGWLRPGPLPPGGVEPEAGETLNYISGHYSIFQYSKGHRFSTDDVLTAWYATQWAPRVSLAADLGSGIGSVALVVAWRLPGARMVTVEAQPMSARLARKSVRYNGLEDRFTIHEGDLRDFTTEERFDLVTGSPPYFPPGTAVEAEHPQAVPARIEVRGTVADYAATAARILAPGGVFAFVFPFEQRARAEEALVANGLVLLRRRDVVFKEGEPPRISLFAAARAAGLPPARQPWIEPPLIIRSADGAMHPEYRMVRLSFGFPPGDVGPEPVSLQAASYHSPMHIVSPILSELDREGASTLKMLERLPADRLAWSPHAKSMSLGQLAWHIASIPKLIVRMLDAGEFDLGGARPASAPEGAADIVGEFKRNMEDIRARVKAFDDDTIRQPFTLKRDGEVVLNMTKIAVLRNIFLNHSIHHRGQLSVYLRLLDVPLPAIYGTTADEAGP